MADRKTPWWQDPRAPQGPSQQPPRREQPPRRQPPQGDNTGGQDWWQDKRVPKQWQDQTDRGPYGAPPVPQNPPLRRQPPPTADGSNAYEAADAGEQDRMMRGAFYAGMNGDTGAMDSFPNTPFGRRLREQYQRGIAARGRKGLGMAQGG